MEHTNLLIMNSKPEPQKQKKQMEGVRLYETMVVNYPYMVIMNLLPTYNVCAIYVDLKLIYTPQN